jgi:hypothetical protein
MPDAYTAYFWEFYYSGPSVEDIGGWGWRKWQGPRLEAQSAMRFATFEETTRDARRAKFDGPISAQSRSQPRPRGRRSRA